MTLMKLWKAEQFIYALFCNISESVGLLLYVETSQ